MPAIIMRSALVFHGHNPPPEVAMVEVDCGRHFGRRVVTWAEVMERRRERQRQILERRRQPDVRPLRAYKVWVAYFGEGLMGGWNAFIENLDGRTWIDRDRKWLMGALMQLFPLVLPLGLDGDDWEAWQIAFARHFKRRTQRRQPLGVAYVWWDGWDVLKRSNGGRPCN